MYAARGDRRARARECPAAVLVAAPDAVGRSRPPGQWNSQTSIPLQRPLEGLLAERESLTLEEAAALEAENRARYDLAPPEGSPGNYNAFLARLRESAGQDFPDCRPARRSDPGADGGRRSAAGR